MGPKDGQTLTTHWIRQELGWDPHKYDKAHQLRASDWAELLQHRLSCRTALTTGIDILDPRIISQFAAPNHLESFNQSEKPEKQLILALLDNPIHPKFLIRSDDFKQAIHNINPESAVWDRTVLDDYLGVVSFNSPMMQDIAERCSEYLDAEEDSFLGSLPHEEEINRSINNVISERFYSNSITSVFVDLSATDEKAIADFKQWLHDKRATTGHQQPRKDFTAKNFEQWAECRVLAYIDLELLCMLEGGRLTDPAVGDLLLPDDEHNSHINRPDHVRKVVRPLAQKLTSALYLDALRLQAT